MTTKLDMVNFFSFFGHFEYVFCRLVAIFQNIEDEIPRNLVLLGVLIYGFYEWAYIQSIISTLGTVTAIVRIHMNDKWILFHILSVPTTVNVIAARNPKMP